MYYSIHECIRINMSPYFLNNFYSVDSQSCNAVYVAVL